MKTYKVKKRTLGNANIFITSLLTSALLLEVFSGLTHAHAADGPIKETNPHHFIELEPITAWQERDFIGSTDYSIKTVKGEKVLAASSNASASMLYKKSKIDLRKTPYLNWKWQINSTIQSSADEKSRDGDDFAARIYVAFKSSRLSIKPKALNYVWASKEKQLSHWSNPYTKSVIMFAIQSGDERSKQWVSEKRNLKQDLERFFGQPIDFIEGIALMTDSDNSKTTTRALYSNLFFSAN